MRKQTGFTLIELLTVIAIIAILAALTFTVGPRMIEKARLSSTMTAMRDVKTAAVAYYTMPNTTNNTYPPGYGFLDWKYKDQIGTDVPAFSHPGWYATRPYTAYLKIYGDLTRYDENWSKGYDTNGDGFVSMGEFLPERINPNDKTAQPIFAPVIYCPGAQQGDISQTINSVMNSETRPFYYFPINKTQFKKFEKYWLNHGQTYGEYWNNNAVTNPDFPFPSQTSFPPSSYDAFVLISPGPGGDTCGIVPETLPPNAENTQIAYHVLSLIAYFRATRDLNSDGILDFDYTSRTQQGQAKFEQYQYQAGGNTFDASNWLPGDLPYLSSPTGTDFGQVGNNVKKNYYGPVIYVVN